MRHRGITTKRRPKEYPILPQQVKFLKALEFCGIKKGITRTELMNKMKNCIPKYYEENKE